MTDRIVGLFFLAVAVAYAAVTLQIASGYTSDALGPKALPLLLASALAVFSLFLIVRPGGGFRPGWPPLATALNLGAAVLSFVVYAMLIVPLGFLVSTTLEVSVLCLLYAARPLQALAAGIVTSFLLYGLFDLLLGLPLPPGEVFGV